MYQKLHTGKIVPFDRIAVVSADLDKITAKEVLRDLREDMVNGVCKDKELSSITIACIDEDGNRIDPVTGEIADSREFTISDVGEARKAAILQKQAGQIGVKFNPKQAGPTDDPNAAAAVAAIMEKEDKTFHYAPGNSSSGFGATKEQVSSGGLNPISAKDVEGIPWNTTDREEFLKLIKYRAIQEIISTGSAYLGFASFQNDMMKFAGGRLYTWDQWRALGDRIVIATATPAEAIDWILNCN